MSRVPLKLNKQGAPVQANNAAMSFKLGRSTPAPGPAVDCPPVCSTQLARICVSLFTGAGLQGTYTGELTAQEGTDPQAFSVAWDDDEFDGSFTQVAGSTTYLTISLLGTICLPGADPADVSPDCGTVSSMDWNITVVGTTLLTIQNAVSCVIGISSTVSGNSIEVFPVFTDKCVDYALPTITVSFT